MDSYSVKMLWILYLSICENWGTLWTVCACRRRCTTATPWSPASCSATRRWVPRTPGSPGHTRSASQLEACHFLLLTKSIDAVLQSYSTWLTLIFAVVVCLQNRLWERPYEVSLYFTNKCTSLEILLNLSLYCVGPQNLYPGAIFHTSNWQF